MSKDLITSIEAAESLAQQSSVSEERKQALDYYLGRPFGTEQAGRSQVVSKDVADTIGWILPAMMKVFMSGDTVCEFTPTSSEDIQAAEQETDYINFIIQQRNSGFIVFHDWFLDALLQKNGYAKAWWHERVEAPLESYRGLTDDELAILLQSDQEIEVVSHEQYMDEAGMQYHNIDLRSKKIKGFVQIQAIPPEQLLVAHNHREVSLANASFVEHWEWKTISELRDEGFDIEDDITDESQVVNSYWEQQNRNDYWLDEERDVEIDPAMRRVKARDIWIRFDKDEDGIAELIHVVAVGKTILEEEEVDFIPIAALCPKPLPHQHYGQSIADDTMDIQEIKSFMLRSHIDNVALANNPRTAVNADRVNIDDLLTSRPGGIVRTEGDPAGVIMPFVHPDTSGAAFQSLEYMDQVRENRTGTNRYFTGVDQNSLNKTASGISQMMNASQQRVELYSRIFAETGVKELFRIVHGLTLRHCRQPEIVRLRNKWIPVDPRMWSDRYDAQVSVGLGTGNKDSQLQHLQMILMAQQQALPLGITTPKNIFNALTKLTQNAGFKSTEEFWTDPEMQPPQPPQPNPEEMKVQGQMQIEQMKLQADQQKFQAQTQIEAQKAQQDLQQEQLRSQNDVAIEKEKIAAQMELERWKAQLDAEVELQKEQMRVQAQQSMKQMEVTSSPVNVNAPDNTPMLEAIAQLMQQQADHNGRMIEALSRPKVATLSSGKQVRIE